MQGVGEAGSRNREFYRKFTRASLIRGLIDPGITEPVLFDVGAHKGESVCFLRQIYPNAAIHSFEPCPESFDELRKAADAMTHVHPLALSDVDGTVELYANKISHTNSLFRVNQVSRDSILQHRLRVSGQVSEPGAFNASVRVRSMRLASFCEQHNIRDIHLLKLDVQGAERRVLDGAAGLLDRIGNIIVEVMLFDYYEHRSSFLEIETVLHPAGFRLFSISDISHNPMNGRTDWVEAIYRRESA